jgi:diguanylate cyclase (GGDEF)-like protein/PAS domain S-box-containing protein
MKSVPDWPVSCRGNLHFCRTFSTSGASLVVGMTGSRKIAQASKMASTHARLNRNEPSGSDGRLRPVHILFVHSHLAEAERCLQELRRVHFTVNAEIVLSPEEFIERLSSKSYDLVLAEHPCPQWRETQALELLNLSHKQIPLIFVGNTLHREKVAEFITNGAYDCIEMDHIGHLPVTIHRALDEETLRYERDRAENGLKHSEARYRALAGNFSYGICRCNPEGKFLEVNAALVKMLGYASQEELLGVRLASDLIQDPGKRAQLLGQSGQQGLIDPLEIEWKRKDGTTLKVRVSGQEVLGDRGEPDTYEVIIEDFTKQRQLEDHLRQQAARDPLTGLANYRRLVEVLDMEIKRAERTGREFALLLFDLDGLKKINDRYGHLIGSNALRRVADVLSFCRDIDTAARHGGDEFAIVLPETGEEAAKRVAERICNSVANDGMEPVLSVSIGVAVYPHDGERIETLLRVADMAMYSMKAAKHKLLDPQ